MKYKDHFTFDLLDNWREKLQQDTFPNIIEDFDYFFSHLEKRGIDPKISTQQMDKIQLVFSIKLEWQFIPDEISDILEFDGEE